MGALTGLVARVRDPRFDRVLLFGWIAMFSIARAGRFEERDPYWQVRAGAENLSGAPLVRPDTWSWSGIPGDWYQNSAGWNDVLATCYRIAGYWGIFALTALLIAGYLLLAASLGRRFGARPLPGMAGMVVLIAGSLSMLSPRATLVVQVLILAAVALADVWAGRWAMTVPVWANALAALVVAGVLSALGNWAHLSFLTMSPVLAAVWAFLWLLSPLGVARRAGLIAGGTIGWLGGLLASPYGLALGLERTRIVQEVCAGLILEWSSPFQPGMDPKAVTAVVVGVALALVMAWWLLARLRAGRRCASEPALLALALFGIPATLASLWAVRFLGIGLLTAAPVVALAASEGVVAARRWFASRPPTRWAEYSEGRFWRPVLAAVTLLLLPGAVWLGSQHAVPAEQELVDQLPAGCRLMNSQTVAGPVILSRPDVKVWIDGRADFYGRAHIEDTYAYYLATNSALVPPGTSCVLLQNDYGLPMAKAMAASPDWRLAVRQGQFELYLPARG